MMDIHGAMQRAEEQARQAGEAMQEAIQGLHDGRKKAWKAAVGTGQAAMQGVAGEYQAWVDAKTFHKKFTANEVEEKMAAASAAAAEPYALSLKRSQEAVGKYTAQAEKAAADAVTSEKKAKALQRDAEAAQAKDNTELAEQKIEESQ